MPTPTNVIRDVTRARAERLEREFTRIGLEAALLFGPDNLEFATGYDVNLDVGLGRPARCALVAIGGGPVVWEHPGVIRVTELTGESTRPRRATDVSQLWLSSGPSAAAFAAEVRATLEARGIRGSIGVDEVSVHLLEAMSSTGIVVRDASSALRRARAVNSAGEIESFRRAVTLAQSAIDAVAERVQPGVDAHEFSAVLTAAAIDRGASEWLVPPAAPRTFTAGDLVAARCCARWEAGYLVDIVRMLPCGQVDAGDRRLLHMATQMLGAVLSRIRAGASASGVVSHARSLVADGCQVSTEHPLLHGCSVGCEHPIVGWLGEASGELCTSMVLSVGFEMTDARHRTVHVRDQVVVTDSGCVSLAVT